MSEDPELDVETVRAELDQIKDAMGLQERYPSQFRTWLVYGLLVPVAAAASQVVELQGLAGWWHFVAWTVTMSLGGIYQWWAHPDGYEVASEGKPRIGILAAGVFAYFAVVAGLLAPLSVSDSLGSVLTFAAIVGLVGVSYVVIGETLRAYYVRRRDRLAFLVGGAWMLALAAAMPNVAALREWGYAVYGVLYALHSLAAYAVLSRTD
jgi:hypothetical protein